MVIVQDVAGYPRRVQALRNVHPRVVAVTPPGVRAHAHAPGFEVPDEWISADKSIPRARRCWRRASMVGLAATRGIDSDFYWFIESDVAAPRERWEALFADWEGSAVDCVSNPVRERARTAGNPWWSDPGTPAWASCFFISAVYRLSRRAVEEGIRCAEETRECFGELALASIVRRAGFSMASANARQTHWNVQTFKTLPEKVVLNPRLVNHPVKFDGYGPLC